MTTDGPWWMPVFGYLVWATIRGCGRHSQEAQAVEIGVQLWICLLDAASATLGFTRSAVQTAVNVPMLNTRGVAGWFKGWVGHQYGSFVILGRVCQNWLVLVQL